MSGNKAIAGIENNAFLTPIPSVVATPPPTEAYLPMLQGTATNRLRATARNNLVFDRNGNAVIEQAGFKAFMKDYAKQKGGLTTGAKKLLDLGSFQLTELNHYRQNAGQPLTTAVSISLEEYGRMRGYDLTPRPTETPEEIQAEKKRIDGVMHNLRKRVNDELEFLYCISLSWTEPKGRKKAQDYVDVRILQSKGIRNGYINMRFSEDIAAYLTQAYIMQYPTALQAVDERNPRTYTIGYKLALHHSMDNNRAKGTNTIISVSALLDECEGMPTYEEVQASKNRGHWERLIKDPLEKALDSLVETHVLTMWEYSNSKGAPLSKSQLTIADYQTFAGLYIHFDMAGEPDQSQRIKRKTERIEAAKAKKPRKKKPSNE